tara:strand:- start:42 stop:431 length:390 start_codon:yes stop_codon:yes gene_type:complete
MNKIIIYSNETCPYCKQIKELLTTNKIEFENRFTSEYKNEWQEIVNLVGMSTVPTILFEGEYLVPSRDFGNPDGLLHVLNNYVPSSFTKERLILEKIKTLNFNMSMAFNKTSQILTEIENKLKPENNEH